MTTDTPRTNSFYRTEIREGRDGWTEAQYEHAATLERENARLREALAVLVEHACETYPHFEDVRGQRDIAAARAALQVQP